MKITINWKITISINWFSVKRLPVIIFTWRENFNVGGDLSAVVDEASHKKNDLAWLS